MSYFHLLLVATLAMAIGTMLLWGLGRAFRLRPLKWVLAIWIDLLWIRWISVIILYTHPLQHRYRVFLLSILVYFVIGFVVGNGTIGTVLMNIRLHHKHPINMRRRFLLVVLYVVSVSVLTAGSNMLEGFDHTASTTNILLSVQGAMAVDIHDVGTYDLVIMDEDHDFAIDRILYDVNKDGKVDIEIQKLGDGSLSWELVDTQKSLRLLFLITAVILLLSLLWHTGTLQHRKHSIKKQQTQTYLKQMMCWLLVVCLLGQSPAHALTISQAQQGLITYSACVQNPTSRSSCAGVSNEMRSFFAELRKPGTVKEFSKFSNLYLACKESNCDSNRIAELDVDFNTWFQNKLNNVANPTGNGIQDYGDLQYIMEKHSAFERMINNTIEGIEQHRRWINFQTELGATNYITKETMLELEIELDTWRLEQLGSLDWVIKELMFELELTAQATDTRFIPWLKNQNAGHKLERQLTRLYRLHRSMQRSEQYKQVSQQHISDEINPYILYTAIGIGEQIVQSNPWDMLLLLGQESLSRIGLLTIDTKRSKLAWANSIAPYLSVIAEIELEELDNGFQQAWLDMIRSWDNPDHNILQKGRAFVFAFARSLQVGWEMVLHETLFMSEEYVVTWRKQIQYANHSYTYR